MRVGAGRARMIGPAGAIGLTKRLGDIGGERGRHCDYAPPRCRRLINEARDGGDVLAVILVDFVEDQIRGHHAHRLQQKPRIGWGSDPHQMIHRANHDWRLDKTLANGFCAFLRLQNQREKGGKPTISIHRQARKPLRFGRIAFFRHTGLWGAQTQAAGQARGKRGLCENAARADLGAGRDHNK